MIRVKTNLKEETNRGNGGREASSCGCAALPQGPDPAASGQGRSGSAIHSFWKAFRRCLPQCRLSFHSDMSCRLISTWADNGQSPGYRNNQGEKDKHQFCFQELREAARNPTRGPFPEPGIWDDSTDWPLMHMAEQLSVSAPAGHGGVPPGWSLGCSRG